MIYLKKYQFIFNKCILIFLLIFLFFLCFILFSKKHKKIIKVINEPILPINIKDNPVKDFQISHFNSLNPRYYFQEKLNKRKLFSINYSYYPYMLLQKNLSYKDNAIFIYNSTGMLNITKLDFFLTNEKIINNYNINHIHLSMAFDAEYLDLSLITIASVLNTSSPDTFIHFHILGLNFGFNEIKKIINLKKINRKVEFIFYNAKQVEYDFERAKNELRGGYGNIARILSPQIINNTNKVLIIDSGDIICQKDLSEIYFYDINDNYFGWILEDCAGNYLKFEDKFLHNNYHPNGGVFLVNIRLFRKDELYKKAIFVCQSYRYFGNPVQSILITIAGYKFKFFPLNYNLNLFYENEDDKARKIKTDSIKKWIDDQQFSPHKYSFDEIYEAISDPVIQHFYHGKLQYQNKCHKYIIQWLKFAKLLEIDKILKMKYPNPFKCERFL
jgi:hypothetical protein